MKRIIIIYGLIATSVFVVTQFGSMPFWKNGSLTFENGELVGYTSMVVALSMVFFGVKSYRDNHLEGSITFGKALQVGLLISTVAALGYAISWEFYFNIFAPDFMDEYASFAISKAKARGLSEEEVKATIAQMDMAKEMYKNPFLRFGMTLLEVFPVGVIISLISAGLLRKKNFLTSQPA